MTRSRFIPNPAFPEAVLRSKEVRDTLADVVERGASIAAEKAPNDPETGSSEDLAGSIRGEVVMTPGGWKGRLLAMNYKALFWEFGTIEHAPRPFLGPAVEELGLELEPYSGPED